jgi:hypothetical protein
LIRRYGFGLDLAPDLAGGSPAENAATVVRVLRGEANDASTAAVVLNAAAALYVGGACATFDLVSRRPPKLFGRELASSRSIGCGRPSPVAGNAVIHRSRKRSGAEDLLFRQREQEQVLRASRPSG